LFTRKVQDWLAPGTMAGSVVVRLVTVSLVPEAVCPVAVALPVFSQ